MKPKKRNSDIVLLIVTVLLLGVLSGCDFKSYPVIDAEKVETIMVEEYPAPWQMDSEQMQTFVELYNASKYAGIGNGEDTTPVFDIEVHFADGTVLYLVEFQSAGRDFKLLQEDESGIKELGYINNPELLDYLIRDLSIGHEK